MTDICFRPDKYHLLTVPTSATRYILVGIFTPYRYSKKIKLL
jgi:hypothetical protein